MIYSKQCCWFSTARSHFVLCSPLLVLRCDERMDGMNRMGSLGESDLSGGTYNALSTVLSVASASRAFRLASWRPSFDLSLRFTLVTAGPRCDTDSSDPQPGRKESIPFMKNSLWTWIAIASPLALVYSICY